MAPKAWDDWELTIAGALDSNIEIKPSDLNGPVHPLFARERWRVPDGEYKTLLPSMHLATNLLKLGMPYIANFLPADRVLKDPAIFKDGASISVTHQHSEADFEAAESELEKLAQNVAWETDYDMYTEFGAWGMNFITEQSPPYHKETPEMIAASDRDLERRGITVRPVTIVIARQYYDTIRQSSTDSEEYLRAVWHAGITMAHEIGHTILLHDTRWVSSDCSEPYVGNDSFSELGLAFTKWIFNGYNPGTVGKGENAYLFDRPLYWRKEKEQSTTPREPYRTHYSISTAYLQTWLTQSAWDDLFRNDPRKVSARDPIKPVIEFDTDDPPATAIVPDFTVHFKISRGQRIPRPVWKAEFKDRSPRSSEPLINLHLEDADNAAELKLLLLDQLQGKGRRLLLHDKDSITDLQDALPLDSLGDDGPHTVEELPLVPDNPNYVYPDGVKTENHVRVEVEYYPLPWASSKASKRRRPVDDDDEEERDFKRLKRGRQVKNEDFDSDDDELEDGELDNKLLDISVPFIESQFTRRQANDFCKKSGIRSFPQVEKSLAWQRGHLGRGHKADLGVISRIRVHFLKKLEKQYFKNKQARLKVKSHIEDSVFDWDGTDLVGYCQEEDLYYDEDGDKHRLIETVKHHMQEEMALIKGYPGKEESPPSSGDEDDLYAEQPLREDWEDKQFIDFFREHGLPTWGNDLVLRERYYAYNFAEKNGYPRPRESNAMYRATDGSGKEVYAWLVNIWARTILDLKFAIYLQALLPANCNLHLSLNGFEDIPDDTMLHEIADTHNEDARFVLTLSKYEAPIVESFEPPAPEPKVIWNRQERNFHAVKQLRAKRKEDAAARAGYAAIARASAPLAKDSMNVAELMMQIGEQRKALDRIFLSENDLNQNTLFPLNNQTKGALHLLDLVEDYEEMNARRGIRGYENGIQIYDDDSDDGDELGRGFGLGGKSHMADVYRHLDSLRRLELPVPGVAGTRLGPKPVPAVATAPIVMATTGPPHPPRGTTPPGEPLKPTEPSTFGPPRPPTASGGSKDKSSPKKTVSFNPITLTPGKVGSGTSTAGAKKLSLKKGTPAKKTSPKKISPKKTSPKKISPKKTSILDNTSSEEEGPGASGDDGAQVDVAGWNFQSTVENTVPAGQLYDDSEDLYDE